MCRTLRSRRSRRPLPSLSLFLWVPPKCGHTAVTKLLHLLPAMLLGTVPEVLPSRKRITIINNACSSWMGDENNCLGTPSDKWSSFHEHRRQGTRSEGCVHRCSGSKPWATSEAWRKRSPSTIIPIRPHKASPSALWPNVSPSFHSYLNRPTQKLQYDAAVCKVR